MKFIKDYRDGDRVFDIYLCKHRQSAVTKNGKPYDNVILQDKTGTIDGIKYQPKIDYGHLYYNVNTELHNYTPILFDDLVKDFQQKKLMYNILKEEV